MKKKHAKRGSSWEEASHCCWSHIGRYQKFATRSLIRHDKIRLLHSADIGDSGRVHSYITYCKVWIFSSPLRHVTTKPIYALSLCPFDKGSEVLNNV